jgi:hypothetical protein
VSLATDGGFWELKDGDWHGPDVIEHLIDAETCVVAFASNEGEFSVEMPHFEFGKTLRGMGVAYVLVRDSTGYRQHYGIQGIGDRAAVVSYLLQLGDKYQRLVLVGLSSGALAAMMYGQLMAMDALFIHDGLEVIAISPYSDVGDPPGAYGKDWQSRGPWDVLSMSLLSDIKPIFEGGPKVKIRAFYSDGIGTEYDFEQAHRIGVTDLTLVPGASHSGLGKLMRDKGLLQKVLLGKQT